MVTKSLLYIRVFIQLFNKICFCVGFLDSLNTYVLTSTIFAVIKIWEIYKPKNSKYILQIFMKTCSVRHNRLETVNSSTINRILSNLIRKFFTASGKVVIGFISDINVTKQ